MTREQGVLVSPTMGVPGVIEGEVVTTIRELATRGRGKQAIARQIVWSIRCGGIFVSRCQRAWQRRPEAQRLTDEGAGTHRRCLRGRRPSAWRRPPATKRGSSRLSISASCTSSSPGGFRTEQA